MTIDIERNTILYVEDNNFIQSSVVTLLHEEGFKLLIADNGDQAIRYIFDEKLEVDAVIIDIDLGEGLNGWEVAECARLRKPAMPILYTSAVGMQDWIANGVPFSRLCAKPFRASQVIAALTSIMRASPPAHVLTRAALQPDFRAMIQ
jgi:DNA-binding response OmpR family regulator